MRLSTRTQWQRTIPAVLFALFSLTPAAFAEEPVAAQSVEITILSP